MMFSRREFMRAAGGYTMAGLAGMRFPGLDFLGPREIQIRDACPAPAQGAIGPERHLLNRLTFGPLPGDQGRVAEMGWTAFIEEQLAYQHIDDSLCDRHTRRLESLRAPVAGLFEYKQDFLQRELTTHTVLRAVYSKRQLYERMVHFWSDHFNVDSSKGECPWLKAADDRDVIRKHALGSFPELLRASALSPAMLWYLDGRSNKRERPEDQPNENYARELLELHTLGVHGGYTQRDVMEVARCLTGWTVRSKESWFGKAKVEFIPEGHDDGEKVVLGERIPAGEGRRDLDHVLRIVVDHPATSRHIARKLCVYFISEEPGETAVNDVSAAFRLHRGDIRRTLRVLFGTAAFRESAGMQFKRPFHFLASALRLTACATGGGGDVLAYLERMGHMPFQYPTPDGYPMDQAPWMGTLLWRWHFAAALESGGLDEVAFRREQLERAFPDEKDRLAHLLGRRATTGEWDHIRNSKQPLALTLASPMFQVC